MGGTKASLRQSIKNQHPLSGLNAKESNEVRKIMKGTLSQENAKTEYAKQLTDIDIRMIKAAIEYYEEVYD